MLRRLALVVLLSPLSIATAANDVEIFEREVRPLLVKHCYRCHSAEGRARGNLRLDSKEGWHKGGDSGSPIKPGDPEGSLLVRAVRYVDDDLKMPPSGKLSDAEIAVLVRWIKTGAADPRTESAVSKPKGEDWGRTHWAFQAPARPAVPDVKSAWARSAVDRFILHRLQKEALSPAGDAAPLALLRRLHFDLIGLPPTLEELQSFEEAATRDPEAAVAAVIERLLASPRFGEHWGRHWLDLARYAETSGATNDLFLIDAWRYRDYVINAISRDKPYDSFITEQIAGDLLPFATLDQRDEQAIATGFLALGIYDFDRLDQQVRLDQIDEQIDVTTRALLGLTVACARCHDHKYDPIPTGDYYALAGVFSSTDICRTAVYTRGKHTLVRVSAGVPLQGYRQEPVDDFIRLQEDLYGGRGAVVDMGWEHNKLLTAARQMKNGAAAAKLREQAARLKQAMAARVAASRQATRELSALPPLPPMALGVREADKTHDQTVRIRGELDKHGPVVPRGVSLLGQKAPAQNGQSGRLELARWLTAHDNPLTARVIVNRVWQHLFGAGLVATVDNFGLNGEPPSHPELLDHLAIEFMEDGWSIKRLIRRLVLSRVYQLEVATHAAGEAKDADNRLLWRMNRRRLPAESIRDAVLAFSGQLDCTPPERSLIADLGPGSMRFDKERIHYDSLKRSIYLPQPRGKGAEVLMQFDGADSNTPVGQRDVTTVPLQALYLLNSPWAMGQSRTAAERLLSSADSEVGRIDLAFRLALSRPATAADVRIAQALLAEHRRLNPRQADATAWASLCQVLIASSEFRYVQ